jgi:hypothetical protein
MDEPRHDFLARARLAGDQHGGVSRRDLRRLAQHVAPFSGLADDLQVRGCLETIDASLHARVDTRCAVVIDVRRDLAEPAAGCTEPEVVRDPTRERHVRAVERQRPLRPERYAHQRLGRAGRHSQHRAVAGRDQPLRPMRGRGCAKRRSPQIVDDHLVDFGRRHVGHVRSRRVHGGSPPLIEARHAQGIVRQHLAHDRGESW